jgi:heme exporter protein B
MPRSMSPSPATAAERPGEATSADGIQPAGGQEARLIRAGFRQDAGAKRTARRYGNVASPSLAYNHESRADSGVGARRSAGGIRRFTSGVASLLWKDLLTEWRRRELVASLVVFSLLVLLVFDFAFDLRSAEVPAAAPGILWVTFIFSGVLSLNSAFSAEKDRGTLEGLLLAPVDRGAIYLAKLLSSFVFMLAVELVALLVFGALFNVPANLPSLAAVVLAGTLGFATVGTLFAGVAANTRAREIFLPVLLFPISVPVIIGSVKATALAFGGPDDGYPWLGLILAFDAIFLAVSFALFEFVIED